MRVLLFFMLSLYPAFGVRMEDGEDADSNQETSGACSDGLYFSKWSDGKGSDADVATKLISADWKDEGDQHYKTSGYDVVLQAGWKELFKSKEGEWQFNQASRGFDSGYSSMTLASCVSGCPPEWQRDEVYKTSWVTCQEAEPGCQEAKDKNFIVLAGCNTAWRRFSQGAKAASKEAGDIVKGAPEAFKKWKKDHDEQERYMWGDAPENACKGGIQLQQKNGKEVPLLNALYVDNAHRVSPDGYTNQNGSHEFKNQKDSSPGIFNDEAILLKVVDSSPAAQWKIVDEVGGLSHFDSGGSKSVVATCIEGCPKTGDKAAWWLDGSHMTVWQVGDEERVNVEAKCCHAILGGPVICSPF